SLIQHNQVISTPTDSHPLALRNLHLQHQSQNKNLIIPPKPLSQLNKIITHTHQDIHIFFPSNQLLFTLPNINFISPLLQPHYPDTTRLFP
ncbi:DNA polymerase III subunit beta family protein, partial [Staphylococcus epidermidis]